MTRFLIILSLLGLAACDLPQSYATPPQEEAPQESGISVSGYARVGVSHSF